MNHDKRYDNRPRRFLWQPEHDKILEEGIRRGRTCSAMAKEIGCKRATVEAHKTKMKGARPYRYVNTPTPGVCYHVTPAGADRAWVVSAADEASAAEFLATCEKFGDRVERVDASGA